MPPQKLAECGVQERYSINEYRIKAVKSKEEKALRLEKFLQLLGLKMASFTDKEKLSPVMNSDIQYSIKMQKYQT